MRLFSFCLLSLIAMGSSVAHADNQRELELRGVKNACGATTTWESEARCYRAGVEGVINNERYALYTRTMCGSTTNWESEARCYRGMIATLSERHLSVIKDACQSTTNWESEALCYRSAFSNL